MGRVGRRVLLKLEEAGRAEVAPQCSPAPLGTFHEAAQTALRLNQILANHTRDQNPTLVCVSPEDLWKVQRVP